MPAILIKIAQWIVGIFGGVLISRLTVWVKERIKRNAKKAEVQLEVEAFKNAKSEDERNKAANDLLDNF